MPDQQTLDVYNAKAEDYAKLPETGVHHTIKHFVSLLPSHALVLDLGCGHGVNAAYFRDQGLQVEAWDLSTSMQKVAKQEFDIDVQLRGFDDLEAKQKYQAICVNYSLLHMPPDTVPNYLSAIAQALQTDGILHLGMKLTDDSEHNTERDNLGRYYAYYPEQQLLEWLEQRGLNVIYSHKSVFAGLAGNPKTGIAIQAKKI